MKIKSLSRQLSLIVVIMIFVSTAAVAVFGYVFYRGETIKLSGERALGVAKTVAAAIDPDGFDSAMTSRVKDAQWERIKAFADKTAIDNEMKYLYILDDKYGDTFTYYAEGYNPITGDPPLDFLYNEDIDVHDANIFLTIAQGDDTCSDAYYDENFGWLITGYAPIFASDGKVTGVVGADIAMEDVMENINGFGIRLIIIVVAFLILFGIINIYLINRTIGRPIARMTVVAEKIAVGGLNPDARQYVSANEIGRLSAAFEKIIDTTKEQIRILDQLADGDLTMKITPRSEDDSMTLAIDKTISRFNEMFAAFQQSSDRLADTSEEIAEEARKLSVRATSQLSNIEQLAGSVGMITDKTKTNAATAENAAALFDDMSENATAGTTQMGHLLDAVKQIDDACHAINNVVASIDEIAFQTNILALNAAVEAAHAGQKGKGFAVVADEVRNLAAKSSSSAQVTAELIANSLEKVALGVRIATQTSQELERITAGIRESGKFIENISAASVEQSREIAAINSSLDHFSEMVQQTAQSAKESADAGGELSKQAEQLNMLLSEFRLS